MAAFIDAEHALDPAYAKAIGVDVDNLLVSQPDYGEQALEIAEMLVRCGALDVVVIDSVAALVPKAEIEGEMGDSHVGLQARLMSQALRKLTGILNQRQDRPAVFTNQLREKIGVMFGNPETTPGGKALKFYASVRLDIRRIETLKDGTEAVGNRVAREGREEQGGAALPQAEFDIMYDEGHLRRGHLLDLGVAHDVVQKSGAFFSYNDERLGQGRANARVFLKENPDIADAIEAQIREKAGLPPRRRRSCRRQQGRARDRSCRRRPSHRRGPLDRHARYHGAARHQERPCRRPRGRKLLLQRERCGRSLAPASSRACELDEAGLGALRAQASNEHLLGRRVPSARPAPAQSRGAARAPGAEGARGGGRPPRALERLARRRPPRRRRLRARLRHRQAPPAELGRAADPPRAERSRGRSRGRRRGPGRGRRRRRARARARAARTVGPAAPAAGGVPAPGLCHALQRRGFASSVELTRQTAGGSTSSRPERASRA